MIVCDGSNLGRDLTSNQLGAVNQLKLSDYVLINSSIQLP